MSPKCANTLMSYTNAKAKELKIGIPNILLAVFQKYTYSMQVNYLGQWTVSVSVTTFVGPSE